MSEWLINNIIISPVVFAILGMGLFFIYCRFQINSENFLPILHVGAWASWIPIGCLFILVAIYPEWANKLDEFRLQLVILSCGSFFYAISKIKETLTKK